MIFFEGQFATGWVRVWSGLGEISWNGEYKTIDYRLSDQDFPSMMAALTAADFAGSATPRPATPPNPQTATLTLTCLKRTAFQVSLDNGQNNPALSSTRRMRTTIGSNNYYLAYELYRDAARSQR